MRILITGATSMLGCTLAPFLEALGHKVIRHGHSATADFACDLTNHTATCALLETVKPDRVINLVAATNVDDCEQNPKNAFLLNVRVVENLVSSLTKLGNTFLVQISTDQVYDSRGNSKEEDALPTNTYALSKYAGELAALNMPATVLRTNFFGPSQHPVRNSFSDWLIENFKNETIFTAFADVSVTPLSMNTLSSAIDRVLLQPMAGVFNLGSHHGMSKADFATKIARSLSLSTTCMSLGRSEDVKLAAYRPKDMCMNSSKFEQAFEMKLPSLEEEINLLRIDGNGTF